MDKCHENRSIHCTVDQCRYHCGAENYCSLNSIKVGTHESDPKMCECVDCQSFERK